MTNTPVSVGELPVAPVSGRAPVDAIGAGQLFGGLFNAALASGADATASEQDAPAAAPGAPAAASDATADASVATTAVLDATALRQTNPQLPTEPAIEAQPLPDAGLDPAAPEAAVPTAPTAPTAPEDALLEAVTAEAADSIGTGPGSELEGLDITVEMSAASPHIPVTGGSPRPARGNSLPLTGAGLPAADQRPPASGLAGSVLPATNPPAAVDPVSTGAAVVMPAAVALQAVAPPVGSVAAAGPQPGTGREGPAQPPAVEAASANGTRADRSEAAMATIANALKAAVPDVAAESARAGSVPAPASGLAAPAAGNPSIAAVPPSPQIRGVVELPTDVESGRTQALLDPADAYARAGRSGAALRAWDDGAVMSRRLQRLQTGPGGQMGIGAHSDVGTAAATRSLQESVANPPSLAPLQAAFASALIRPTAPRAGSSAVTGADSGADPLAVAAEASDVDASAQNPVGSNAVRTADSALRAELPRLDPVLGTQVAAQLARQIQQGMGSSNLHIRLNPAELGQVDVQLRMDGDRVHVAITAHQAATRDLIEVHLSSLRAALENGGLSLGDVDVRHSAQGGPQGGAQGDRERLAGSTGDQRRDRSSPADAPGDVARAFAAEGPAGRTIDAFV